MMQTEQQRDKLAKRRRYYANNRELVLSRNRRYRAKNKQILRAKRRRSYLQNKEHIQSQKRRHDKQRLADRRAQTDALKDRPCMDCGQCYPPFVMAFDHRDPAEKLFGISTAVSRYVSMELILIEIEKCDVVCANCHAVRTWGGRE